MARWRCYTLGIIYFEKVREIEGGRCKKSITNGVQPVTDFASIAFGYPQRHFWESPNPCYPAQPEKEECITKNLDIYTLQTLYSQPLEPVDFLVDGLLTPGLYILGGSPKVGKSWLAMQLCLAVCTGSTFLGRSTKKSEVLYLALEDGPQRLHNRALHLIDTAPAGLYLCGQAMPIGQGLEQQLETALNVYPNIRLVIVDTLQKVRNIACGSMSYGGDYQDAAALKSLADRNHVCVLVIHHLRKMPDDDPFNRLSGTNGLTGAADGTLILMRTKRQENTAVLAATGRDIEDMEETLEFDDCRWNRATAPEQILFGKLVIMLKNMLCTEDGFEGSATELADRLGTEGEVFGPARLSKYLQARGELLKEQGIELEVRRTNSKRLLRLQLCDGSDGDDRMSAVSACSELPS